MSGEPFDITPSNDGGVLKLITKEGTSDERPPLGSSVTVHYTGTLLDGTKFDSSRDKNTPFSFSLGQGQVIKGWDIGVASMRRGEMCVLTIASEYAYGASGSPPKIPPGATLKFEVELLSWAAEDISPDRDGSISREKIVPGEHLANPNDTSNVDVHIVGTHEGRVFLDKELSFVLGEGCVHDLPEGVDRALRRFEKGEKSKISLRGARFTYGANPPAAFNLPPNAPIQFTIFLKDYEKVPHTWEMTAEQKLEASKAAKERGTFFLQSGNIRLAVDKYKRVEEILEYEKTISDEAQKKERNALLLAAYLNLALAETKRNELNAAVKYCDKALEMDAKNVKALYRRATAKITASDYEDAKATLKTILDIEPDNKAAQQQILVCQQKMKEVAEKEKKCFRGMFSKLGSGEGEKKEQKNPFEEAGPSGEEPTAA